MEFILFIKKFKAIAFNIPVTVSIIQELLKMTVFANRLSDVRANNDYTEKTFWNVRYDPQDLLILNQCNKTCIVSCGIFFFLVLAIAVHYITIPMLGKLIILFLNIFLIQVKRQ